MTVSTLICVRADLGAAMAAILVGAPCAAPIPAHAGGVLFFDAPDAFHAAALADGSSLHAFEDFEDGDVPPDTGIGMDDPLDAATNNSVFRTGEIVAGLRIQSNDNGTPSINDPGTDGPSPVGAGGLVALGPGADGATDVCVAPTAFGFSRNSLDVIAIAPTVRAVSMRIADLFPTLSNAIEIAVFDRDENLIGETTVEGDGAVGAFVGIVLEDPGARIGRINLWGVGPAPGFGGDEALYEIALHGVCPLDLDASGAIDFADLLGVLAAWGESPSGPPDFDGSGEVGFTDLLAVLAGWGQCP